MGKLGENNGKLMGPGIGVEDTEAILCESCGNNQFVQTMMLQRVPAVLTGTGKEGILPIPVFACTKCGHVNTEFLPQELKNEKTLN